MLKGLLMTLIYCFFKNVSDCWLKEAMFISCCCSYGSYKGCIRVTELLRRHSIEKLFL